MPLLTEPTTDNRHRHPLPLLLVLVAALTGCGVLPKAPGHAVYALPDAVAMGAGASLPGVLLVELPQALPPLDGERIIVRLESGEVQLLPGARWAAPAPRLLQALIARQVELAAAAPSALVDPQPLRSRFRLGSRLEAFELIEVDGRLQVRTRLLLRLVCTADGSVIASSEPIAVEAAGGPVEQRAAVGALRQAAGLLARQVVFWLQRVEPGKCGAEST